MPLLGMFLVLPADLVRFDVGQRAFFKGFTLRRCLAQMPPRLLALFDRVKSVTDLFAVVQGFFSRFGKRDSG